MPRIPDYIGQAILLIAEGVSKTPKFVRRQYRDELVGEGVRNCVKAIKNFDINAPTRSGSPNAYGYFSKICYYAYLTFIENENEMLTTHMNYMRAQAIESFLDPADTEMRQTLQWIDEATAPYEQYDKSKKPKKSRAKKTPFDEFEETEELDENCDS